MFRFLSTIILITNLFSSSAFAELLKDINVIGNQRISKDTIIVLGKIELGSDYNDERLNTTLKNLYNSDFFEDVKINLENGVLSIKVIENLIIEDIQITGIKSQQLEESLTENISLKNRMSFNENLLRKDITLIKNILKANGFYFVKIDSSITKNEELNSVKIILDIDQGE